MNDPISSKRWDLPEIGVRRPWLILVLNLLIAIGGVAALFALEVRELPNVDRPVVSVSASLPRILEGAVARVAGVAEIRSSSEENNARVYAEFRSGINVDQAATDVREAVNRIQRELPNSMDQLTVTKADKRAGEIIRLAVKSSVYDETDLARLIEQDIVPRIISLPGVADAPVFGSRQQVLRIILDPLRLTSYGLSVSDIVEVLRATPLDVPAGSFRTGDQQLLVRADAAVTSESDIGSLIIRDKIRVNFIGSSIFANLCFVAGPPLCFTAFLGPAGSRTQ